MPKAVTEEELHQICEALRKNYSEKLQRGHCREGEIIWHVPMFWFALYTGLRASELARLRWGSIDFDKRLIYIRVQKNKKEQTIPLNKKAAEVLEEVSQGESEDYVFRSPGFTARNRSINTFRSDISRTFTRYRRLAGIQRKVTLHGTRHGHCTLLAEHGKPAYVIQASARHADISTSMRYVHIANEHLKAELDDVFS